jgi:hypothetical protein
MSDLSHIFRETPPWRVAKPLTECGREPASVKDVIHLDEAVARYKREGSTRAAYTMCMTCIGQARYRGTDWTSWERDPVQFVSRDCRGPHADLARKELHALATLVSLHAEEFRAILEAGNDLADRRAQKQKRRRRA